VDKPDRPATSSCPGTATATSPELTSHPTAHRWIKAKAVMRSGLWDPERRLERSVFPSLSQVLRDHCRDATIPDEATLRAELALEL
jgi:hypothetical protein